MKQNILAAVTLLSLSSCAHKQQFSDLSSWNEEPGKSVQLSLRSLKDKSKKADLIVAVKNMYPFPVIVTEGSIHYARGGDDGVSHEGNPRRILNTGDSASFMIHYQFASSEKGQGVLKLENLFAGKAVEVQGVNRKEESRGVGSAVAVGGPNVVTAIAGSRSNTNSNAETYVKRSATEGEALPGARLEVPN